MRVDVVTLVSSERQTDSAGFPNGTNVSKKDIVASVSDVARSEFYAAKQAGYNASMSVEISPLDYHNESELLFRDKKYRIIRAYRDSKRIDTLILTCEEIL